jgi:hypothetical protein
MTANDELKIVWKEAVVAYFNVIFHYFPGVIEKTISNLSHGKRHPSRDSNQVLPVYKLAVLTTRSVFSIVVAFEGGKVRITILACHLLHFRNEFQ